MSHPVVASTILCLLIACAGVPVKQPTPSLGELLADESARVMWVAAHPDDEALAGPLLARACIGLRRPCLFVVLNRGDGGECLLPNGCHPDLGTVRAQEMKRVALAYNAELVHLAYFNAPLPVESFPTREAIGQRWLDAGDPAERIARAIQRFKPTILLTFDPRRGFTGHPEHQLTSRFATEAVRRAAPSYRVDYVFHVLNRYWFFGPNRDPCCPTETFNTHVPCGPPNKPCIDIAMQITKEHRTQAADMGRVRSVRPQMGELYLRRIDPFDLTLAPPPLEREEP